MTTATHTEPATVHQVRSLGRRIMDNAKTIEHYAEGVACCRTPRLVLATRGKVPYLLELAASLDWEVA